MKPLEEGVNDLLWHVRSWTGPAAGAGEPKRPCVYAFQSPGKLTRKRLIKIGSTEVPVRRLYQLRWGPTVKYMPDDAHKGSFVHVAPAPNIECAREAERIAHQMLSECRMDHEITDRQKWKVEWFDVDEETAARAINDALVKVVDLARRRK